MQLAGFTLDTVIHAVGDTVVATARDADGQPVVLKLLDTDLPAPAQLARWRHEYALLQSISSPYVIRARSLQAAGRSLVLVLEDFGRCNLAQVIERHHLSLIERLQLAVQLTQAISAVHAHGLVHGDVAPKNVLVDLTHLRLKLCDFGLASTLDHEARRSPDGFPHGTLAYVAPEQTGRTNLDIDQRSDFYSLGATLYELFGGRPPFQIDDPAALLHAQLALLPTPLQELDPAIPPLLAALVAKLLAKDPDARYQSSHGLLLDLQQALQQLQLQGRIDEFPLGRHDVSERFRVAQRLVGREAQVAALRDAFTRSCGGRSELLLVSGYSGVGKSALVAALHEPVMARRGYYLRGKCDQYRRHRPYAALADAFRALMQQLAVEGRDAYWRTLLVEALGEHAAAVGDLVPELELLIGSPPPLPVLPAADTETRLHLTFGRFVQALARRTHPLLLFLDDLQWADAATLRLLEELLRDDREQALLLVGAFRDNEVDERHPLRTLQAALRRAGHGRRIGELQLGPLAPEAVRELVAETLRCGPSAVDELAALCAEKTGGNPFFLVQFLRQLHEQGDLRYDRDAGLWRWELEAIRRRGMTANVVELMLGQLRRLPQGTQSLLAQAAGLGEVFSLGELMALADADAAATAASLWPALQAGLLLPLTENYRFSDSPALQARARYRFLHDRVQQAAHELTAPDQRAALMLQTGRRLLAGCDADALEQRLFTVLECLNQGSSLIDDADERGRLLALNLRGADKARTAAAHPLAVQLLQQALLLGPSTPAQTLQLYLGLCESSYLAGDFDAAEALYPRARAACPAPLAQAQLLAVQADQYNIQGRFGDAFDVHLEALALLGQPFPADEAAAFAVFPDEFAAVMQMLAAQPAERLLQAAELTDPVQLLQLRLLYAMTFSSYQTARFGAFVVDACRMLRITLQHGQCDLSTIACLAFMTAMSVAKQPYAACYAMGATALRLAEQRGDRYTRVTAYQYFNAFYQHWGEPLAASLAPQDRGLELGLAGVNPLSAGFCALLRCVNRFIVGTPLGELAQEAERSLKYLQASRQPATEAMLRHGVLQPLQALLGHSLGPLRFDSAEQAGCDALLATEEPSIPWAMASTAMLRHALLMDDEASWRQCAGRLDRIGLCLPDSPSWVEARLYIALGQLRYDGDAEAVAPHLALFDAWATGCEANYRSHQLLLAAELARLRQDERGAMDLYARAIASASEHGWVVLEALANELYARFWTGLQQRQLAKQFIREAYYQYRRWGATLKCRQLETAWPQEVFRVALQRPFGSKSLGSASAHSGSDMGSLLDLQSLLKANQLLAQEIQLDALLRQMFSVLLENAGAEQGGIVLLDDGRLIVETVGGLVAQRRVETRRLSLPLSDAEAQTLLPVPLIEYVRLTRQTLVLNQPAQDPRFAHSAYLAAQQPKSVLCLPVMYQGQLVALVYLENSLLEDAFTLQRQQTLELLSSQAAISLIHARLVESLESKVAQRTEALRRMSMRDGLTGIANRRAFDESLQLEWRRSQRLRQPLALMMIDIDHFKLFNDHYGHIEGDACIRLVAQVLQQTAERSSDSVARYGGEEFAVLLPHTEAEAAARLARDCLAEMAAEARVHAQSPTAAVVTLSIGVASLIGDEQGPERLLRAADEALYAAKRGGRNRVVVAG